MTSTALEPNRRYIESRYNEGPVYLTNRMRPSCYYSVRRATRVSVATSDVNKDWTHKDKEKD